VADGVSKLQVNPQRYPQCAGFTLDMAGTTGLEPATSAVTESVLQVFQQLTGCWGLPKYLKIRSSRTDFGLVYGLGFLISPLPSRSFHLDFSLILLLSFLHVPNSQWPQDLRGDLQALPPRRANRAVGVPLPVHHRRVPPVQRSSAVQAERSLSRSGRPTRGSAIACRRPLMFDPDAHMPRINRGMVYLTAARYGT